jgi:hypothetical protein
MAAIRRTPPATAAAVAMLGLAGDGAADPAGAAAAGLGAAWVAAVGAAAEGAVVLGVVAEGAVDSRRRVEWSSEPGRSSDPPRSDPDPP